MAAVLKRLLLWLYRDRPEMSFASRYLHSLVWMLLVFGLTDLLSGHSWLWRSRPILAVSTVLALTLLYTGAMHLHDVRAQRTRETKDHLHH